MSYRAGDLRNIYDDHEVQKSLKEKQATMERLEIIKNAKGPMLRSKLALLATGSLKGYTFSNAADAPSSSSAPGSSSDPQRKPETLQGTSVKHRVLNRSRGHLSARALNLGHWERSRKRSAPQCFHHLIDWDAACTELERDVLEEHGWMTATATSPDKTLLRGIRANPWPCGYIHHIAGARTVRRYKETPLQYAIFEACFGDEPRRKDWACPTTRKLSVSSYVKTITPRVR